MKKKILLIANFSETGGTLTYFKQLVKLLITKEDVHLHLFLKKHHFNEDILRFIKYNNLQYSIYHIPNIALKRVIGSRFNQYISVILSFLYLFIKYLIHRPHLIIQSTGSHTLFNLFLLPTKVLLIQHSLQLSSLDRINTTILSGFLGHHKRIITVSTFAKNSLIKAFQINSKKSVFCDSIYNSHITLNIKDKQPINTKITILTLGHVEKYKNPKFFFDVAKKLISKYNNIEFIWAGKGSLLEKFRDRTQAYNNICFIGHQNNISDLYTNSSIYFQPSMLESHGISILGAMATKLPCVVANIGGMPESVVHNQTGFVYESNNLSEAINYIEKLMENTELRQQFGENGYNRYKELFTPAVWEYNMSTFLKENFNV